MRSDLLLDNQATLEIRIRASFDRVLEHRGRCGVCCQRDRPRCSSGLVLFRRWRLDVDVAAAVANLRRRKREPRWGRGVDVVVEIPADVEWKAGTWTTRRTGDLTYARPRASISWNRWGVEARRRRRPAQ